MTEGKERRETQTNPKEGTSDVLSTPTVKFERVSYSFSLSKYLSLWSFIKEKMNKIPVTRSNFTVGVERRNVSPIDRALDGRNRLPD